MRTTQILSTKAVPLSLTVLLGALLVGPVCVQAQAQPSGNSRATRLEWPRTFTGQPDFLFTREEAIAEARARAARSGQPLTLTPSIKQLLEDDAPLDPLGILKPKEEEVTVATDASGTLVSGTEAMPQGITLMERLLAQSVDLPTIAASAGPDLTEFRSRLNSTITATVSAWQPSAGKYDFSAVIQTLVLQAIVQSPVKYAVINQQRYKEGDSFRISVPVPVPDTEIMAAMDAVMPVSGTLPADVYAGYTTAYKEVWDSFTFKRNQTPELGRQTLVLPVRITAISARQVLLDVNGQSYELPIRYAY